MLNIKNYNSNKFNSNVPNNKYCSPVISGPRLGTNNNSMKKNNVIISATDETCLDYNTLVNIAKSFNKYLESQNKTNKQPNNLNADENKYFGKLLSNKPIPESFLTNSNKASLYAELKKRFFKKDDIFWFEDEVIKKIISDINTESIKSKYFKVIASELWYSNPKQWLSNHDINKVLKQYEDKYPEFKSFGAMPIDFHLKDSNNSCKINEICEINLDYLYNSGKKKYIGAVFNLDKHTQSGSHWIALYVNIPSGEINFWDSTSNPPPLNVKKLMNQLEAQLIKLNSNKNNNNSNKIKKQINTYQHQYKNTECGVYCLYFITEQLDKNRSFIDVCKKIVDDDTMNRMRENYFSIIKSK